MSPHPDMAKGQLSSSSLFQLSVEPKIIHVVGFCEGDHAATPSDIIESANITRGVIENYFLGSPRIHDDPRIEERKKELVDQAKFLLQAIKNISSGNVEDPWTDPNILARSILMGFLDAPHLAGNPHAAGKVITQIRNGACYAVDTGSGNLLSEKERISRILGTSQKKK